jgi:hypothetical protein
LISLKQSLLQKAEVTSLIKDDVIEKRITQNSSFPVITKPLPELSAGAFLNLEYFYSLLPFRTLP